MLKKLSVLICLSFLAFPAFSRDQTNSDLIKQIDYLQQKHEVLATNVANSNSPKYRAKDLEAPDFMHRKSKVKAPKMRMKITNNRHIKPNQALSSNKYKVLEDNSGAMKPNKNNVNLAKQVSKMAANSDEMSAALKHYRSNMDLISTASDQGGHR